MDWFQSDTEKEYDAQEGRLYKMKAKDALNKRTIKQTMGWNSAFSRWKENREKLDAYRAGTWQPEPRGFEADWGKIAYTGVLQSASLFIAVGCIYNGVWWASLLTIPLFLALNFFFLAKDSENDE